MGFDELSLEEWLLDWDDCVLGMFSIACDALTLEVVTANSLEFIDDELSAGFSGMLG